MPFISVLTSVYNAGPYLRESIESVLGQTFGDFEFILVDDASNDGSWDIASEYAARDRRIRLFRNERNLRLPQSLNRGLREAKGEYIARHDADDISLSDRFARQLAYVCAHPEIDVFSGQMNMVDAVGKVFDVMHFPLQHSLINWYVFFGHCFGHPCVLIRRKTLEEARGYDPGSRHAEDLDLWARLAGKARFANLPDVLAHYRILDTSVCRTHRIEQASQVVQIRQRLASRVLGRSVSREVLTWARDALRGYHSISPKQYQAVERLTGELFHGMCAGGYFLPGEVALVEADKEQQLLHIRQALADGTGASPQEFLRRTVPAPLYKLAMGLLHPKVALQKMKSALIGRARKDER